MILGLYFAVRYYVIPKILLWISGFAPNLLLVFLILFLIGGGGVVIGVLLNSLLRAVGRTFWAAVATIALGIWWIIRLSPRTYTSVRLACTRRNFAPAVTQILAITAALVVAAVII